MADVTVNLFTRPNANLNPAVSGSELINCHFDAKMALNLRPGTELLHTLGTNASVDGLYYWTVKDQLVIVSGGHIFIKTSRTATPVQVTTSPLLAVGSRVTFATNGVWIYLANGGQIVRCNGTDAPEVDPGPYAPNPCTHLVFIDGYILGNLANTGRFYYAEPDPDDANAALIWSAYGMNAEGSPDNLVALGVGWREVMALGSESAEIWWNDGVTPFIRQDGAFVETGTLAPHTLQKFGNTWIWLNDQKKIIRLNERTPETISDTLDLILQDLQTVTDAYADIYVTGGKSFYLITFPTENKTLALDLANGDWSMWSAWDDTAEEHNKFPATCGTRVPGWKVNYFGDSLGRLHRIDASLYQDGSNPIMMQYRSEHLDAGSRRKKRSNRVILFLKRGFDYARFGDTQDEVEPHYPNSGDPVITDTSIDNGWLGVAYSHQFTATGGNVPNTWSQIAAPAGLSLSSTGLLSGTPTETGVFTVTVRVTDSEGLRDQESFVMTIGVRYSADAYLTLGATGATS